MRNSGFTVNHIKTRFLPRMVSFAVGLGACTCLVVVFAWAARESSIVRNVRLTVDETLALVPTFGSAHFHLKCNGQS